MKTILSCIYLLLSVISLNAVTPKDVFLPTTDFVSSFPYITGDTLRGFCDHKLDPITTFKYENVQPGDTIFVMFDYLGHFFDEIHPNISNPYILITHHFYGTSDDPVPGDKYAEYLDDQKLMGWFSHNVDRKHDKLHPLPLGIGPPIYAYGNKSVFDKCVPKRNQELKKSGLLYVNFSIETSPTHRIPVFNFFKDKSFCTFESNIPLEKYLQNLSIHKFVISPRGNGLDCFRTWEALLMKTYPIVITSTLDPLFEELPVVIIENWSEITEDFLEKKYIELMQKEYNWDKLYLPYWLQKIQDLKNRFI